MQLGIERQALIPMHANFTQNISRKIFKIDVNMSFANHKKLWFAVILHFLFFMGFFVLSFFLFSREKGGEGERD